MNGGAAVGTATVTFLGTGYPRGRERRGADARLSVASLLISLAARPRLDGLEIDPVYPRQ